MTAQSLQTNTRQAMRVALRAQRLALSTTTQAEAAQQAAAIFSQHPLLLSSTHIGCYWAFNGELDPAPFMALATANNKQLYLPVLHPSQQKLLFVHYQAGDSLQTNRLGIVEPQLTANNVCFPWNLDLVLMPLVAFDANRHRLGMGAGFYDRTFAYRAAVDPPYCKRPVLLGYAYAFQQVAAVPNEPWDIPMDGVVTELGVSYVARV